MEFISLEIVYLKTDGSKEEKIISSQKHDDTIGNMMTAIRREFQINDTIELYARIKIFFTKNPDTGNDSIYNLIFDIT